MLEFFTDMLGRHRLMWGIGLIGVNLFMMYVVGVIWFFLWAIAIVLCFSAFIGEF